MSNGCVSLWPLVGVVSLSPPLAGRVTGTGREMTAVRSPAYGRNLRVVETGGRMPRKPPQQYTVHREQDGAHVGGPYDLATARGECARLGAESRVVVRQVPATVGPDGSIVFPAHTLYASMYLGEVCRFEIRSTDGLVIA